jgi:hypothetical protein
MTWTDMIHIGNTMVAEGGGHGIEFYESTIEITFDFKIDGLDSS